METAPLVLPVTSTSSGLRVELVRLGGRRRGGGSGGGARGGSRRYELRVGGVPQSRVSLDDPSLLEYEYVQWVGRMLDAIAAPGAPVRCLHLGAGALTVPRYVAWTRPGSEQVVVEFERELFEAIVQVLPLTLPASLPSSLGDTGKSDEEPRAGVAPSEAGIEVVFGDAREVVEGWASSAGGAHSAATHGGPWGDGGRAEFAVVDLWDAATIRARVASLEFYADVKRVTAERGTVVVNLLDGADFEYGRRQAATLRTLFGDVVVVLDEAPGPDSDLQNVLIVATDGEPWAADAVDPRTKKSVAPGPTKARPGAPVKAFALRGDHLTRWVGDATPMTDTDGTDSPSIDDPRFA